MLLTCPGQSRWIRTQPPSMRHPWRRSGFRRHPCRRIVGSLTEHEEALRFCAVVNQNTYCAICHLPYWNAPFNTWIMGWKIKETCRQKFCLQVSFIFQRRWRDLNPRASKADLPDFESGPFSRLGTSPEVKSYSMEYQWFHRVLIKTTNTSISQIYKKATKKFRNSGSL